MTAEEELAALKQERRDWLFEASAAANVLKAELERYKAAVEVAREKGEHYPTCNMPPLHLRTAGSPSDPEYKAWREVSRGKCDCWKAQMEAKLR